MSNPKDRNIDSGRRDDRRAGTFDICEIINVWPHIDPFPGDVDFNVCDIQLIDRVVGCCENSVKDKCVKRVRLKCLQRHHSHLQGEVWNPRIGSQILVAWIKNREGVILGTLVNPQEEPVCRSQATPEDQERVYKRSPWEPPERDENGNYVTWPHPKHPDCEKWWPYTRDFILIHDCPYGHNRAYCDKKTPCNCLDDIQAGTWLKQFSDISPTHIDLPRRTKYHHHCGSIFYFDETGDIHLQGAVAEDPRGWLHHYPLGTMLFQAEPEADTGAQHMVVANADEVLDSDGDSVASRQIYFDTDSYIEILKDGKIKIKSGSNTTTISCSDNSIDIDGSENVSITASVAVDLTAPDITLHGDVHITGDLDISGTCNRQYIP